LADSSTMLNFGSINSKIKLKDSVLNLIYFETAVYGIPSIPAATFY
jgi:hypothetical protein